MKWQTSPLAGWRALIFLLLFFAVSLRAATKYEPAGKITVLVFVYTDVNDKALRRAERETQRLFDPAGIRVEWINCSREQSPEPCRRPPGADTLILVIRPGSAAARKAFHLPQKSCGFALRGNGEVKGTRLILFHDCVQKTAGDVREPVGTILGHVVAHEMAHLFFLRDRHSSSGLMQARLGPEDWKLAATGELRFTDADLEEIRAGFEARLFAERTSGQYARSRGRSAQPD